MSLAIGGLLQFNLDLFGNGKIAYLDAENTLPRFGIMLKQKMALEGLDPQGLGRRVVYISTQDIGLSIRNTWEERSEALAEALALNGVRFVIGDTLGRLWAPPEITASEWVQRGFAPFRMACKSRGVSGLMLTHTKRPTRNDPNPSQPLGTSFQESQADAQIFIQRTKKPQSAGLKLTVQKCRRAYWIQQGSSVSVRFTPKLNYEIVGDGENPWPHECPKNLFPTPAVEPDTQELVYLALVNATTKTGTTKQLSKKLNLSVRTIRGHLQKLRAEGRVSRIGKSRNTCWRPV